MDILIVCFTIVYEISAFVTYVYLQETEDLEAVVRFILIAVPIVNTIMMIIAFLSLAYNFER